MSFNSHGFICVTICIGLFPALWAPRLDSQYAKASNTFQYHIKVIHGYFGNPMLSFALYSCVAKRFE